MDPTIVQDPARQSNQNGDSGAPVQHQERQERRAAWLSRLEQRICTPDDDEETRHRKVQLLVASVLMIATGPIWGGLYWANGEMIAGLMPITYAIATALNVTVLLQTRNFAFFRVAQTVMILLLPAGVHIALGGFVGSSVAILWSLIAVLLGLLFANSREAPLWLAAYVITVTFAGVVAPGLVVDNNLPDSLVWAMFLLNVLTVSAVAFGVLFAFVTDRRRLRELEVAYLNQEMLLRQSEKLATLGTLAAGVTHELNNPAAAARRAAQQLAMAFADVRAADRELSKTGLTPDQWNAIAALETDMRERADKPLVMDAVTRADAEEAVEAWLGQRAISEPWSLAPVLVAQGKDGNALEEVARSMPTDSLGTVIVWMARVFPVHSLIHDIGQASGRISEIVAALKSYAYVGQAPLLAADIHDGLESTLVMLRGKMPEGLNVIRDYCTDMPEVPIYGTELNQVWTNLLDNAIDAVGPTGTITIRTRRQGDWGVVDVEDDGPGIPADVQARIFDPFFTTKAPGKGTGLGLSTSHSIIEKHHGHLRVESAPGRTRFRVELPLDANGQQGSSSH